MHYLSYVNTRMNDDPQTDHLHGCALSYTQLPWAMVSFVPQTDEGTPHFFSRGLMPSAGIRLSHRIDMQSGDYGTFLMAPQVDKTVPEVGKPVQSCVQGSVSRPHELSIRFLEQQCTFSVTPTLRGGMLSLHFDRTDNRGISFYPLMGTNTWHYDAETRTLFGTTTGCSAENAVDFKMYIVIRLGEGTVDTESSHSFSCDSLGEGYQLAFLENDVTASLAVSYLSTEQAEYNLTTEIGSRSYTQLLNIAERCWEEHLGRIAIQGTDDRQLRIFYSCLYRVFLSPHRAYEWDAVTNEAVHYCPLDGTKRRGVRYTDIDFSLAYRTVFPLYALIARREYAEMLEGFLSDFRDGGWLPRKSAMGEIGCMPSTMIDAVIADAAVKGIGTRSLWALGLEGMLRHANRNGQDARFSRYGAEYYCKLGYLPMERYSSSVSLTMDAAYGDYCIARVAKVLGHDPALVSLYDNRSKNGRRLFDPKTALMCGKTEKDCQCAETDPYTNEGAYAEGVCAWQANLALPHDTDGLIQLHGGTDALTERLDAWSASVGEDTLLAQALYSLPFLYRLLGKHGTADQWVEKLVRIFELADGCPSGADPYSAAAWYIFATLGVYPFCPGMPGTGGYVRGQMRVPSAEILGGPWKPEVLENFI